MANPQNYITEDTTIKGSITTASSLTVAGAIEGDVNAGGEVIVLDDAFVKGDVSGPNVRIQGKVEGRITASGRLVISSSGEVHGNISVRSLLIEEGGTLQGECSMGAAAAKKLGSGPRPAAREASPNPSASKPAPSSDGVPTSNGTSNGSGPIPTAPMRPSETPR